MRLSLEPAPPLPQFRSLVVHGPYDPSAPIHLCLSIPHQDNAILFSPSRHSLLQGLQEHNNAWLNAYSGTGTVSATSSRVTIFYPTSPKHLVAVLAMLRVHNLSSAPVPIAPKVTLNRAPTLLVLHEPSAYLLPKHEEHTLSSYLLLIIHALSTIEFLSISSPASLVVFDTQLDHLKLPLNRTPQRGVVDGCDDSEDGPRPESVLFFVKKYFELSGTFQCHTKPTRVGCAIICLYIAARRGLCLKLLTSICVRLVYIQIASFQVAHNMPSESDVGFFSLILKPGSSLHPSFLLALDCAFAALFLVFAWSAYLTNGSVHFFFLMLIEIALWASIKWFVQQLRMLPVSDEAAQKKNE